MKFRFALLAIMISTLASVAMAAPIGNLLVANCTGQGVTVTASTLDWLPAGGGTGCIATGNQTLVNFVGGGPLVSGDTSGLIKDLTFPGPSPILDFMFFTDQPNLHFDLVGVGPGPTSTACATTLDPNAPACTVFVGSPIKLSPTSSGTTVSLSANGTASDLSADVSNWIGDYSTTFPGITPAQLQSAINSGTPLSGFCSGGACTSTYSGTFVVTFTPGPTVPEPLSLVLIGGGLIGLACMRRFKRAA